MTDIERREVLDCSSWVQDAVFEPLRLARPPAPGQLRLYRGRPYNEGEIFSFVPCQPLEAGLQSAILRNVLTRRQCAVRARELVTIHESADQILGSTSRPRLQRAGRANAVTLYEASPAICDSDSWANSPDIEVEIVAHRSGFCRAILRGADMPPAPNASRQRADRRRILAGHVRPVAVAFAVRDAFAHYESHEHRARRRLPSEIDTPAKGDRLSCRDDAARSGPNRDDVWAALVWRDIAVRQTNRLSPVVAATGVAHAQADALSAARVPGRRKRASTAT